MVNPASSKAIAARVLADGTSNAGVALPPPALPPSAATGSLRASSSAMTKTPRVAMGAQGRIPRRAAILRVPLPRALPVLSPPPSPRASWNRDGSAMHHLHRRRCIRQPVLRLPLSAIAATSRLGSAREEQVSHPLHSRVPVLARVHRHRYRSSIPAKHSTALPRALSPANGWDTVPMFPSTLRAPPTQPSRSKIFPPARQSVEISS